MVTTTGARLTLAELQALAISGRVSIRGDIIPRARGTALPRLAGALRYTVTGPDPAAVERVAAMLARDLSGARVGGRAGAVAVYVPRREIRP